MKRLHSFIIWILILMFPVAAVAQNNTLYGFLGAGVGYDAFLRDQTITKYKNDWPFELGVQGVMGLRYQTGQSFDAMLDISGGFSRILFPVPDGVESRTAYRMKQILVMAGTGIHVSVDENNIIMPFMQIGAGFYRHSGYTALLSATGMVDIPGTNPEKNISSVTPVLGAGIDWQSRLVVPASFNLRFVYTPLSFFENPVEYNYTDRQQVESLSLQGKMLQAIITFRVYMPVAKWKARY